MYLSALKWFKSEEKAVNALVEEEEVDIEAPVECCLPPFVFDGSKSPPKRERCIPPNPPIVSSSIPSSSSPLPPPPRSPNSSQVGSEPVECALGGAICEIKEAIVVSTAREAEALLEVAAFFVGAALGEAGVTPAAAPLFRGAAFTLAGVVTGGAGNCFMGLIDFVAAVDLAFLPEDEEKEPEQEQQEQKTRAR
jgi:hypothetical protein